MLDIAHFRVDQGGNPETVRESQRRRFADVDIVDKVIALDEEWRKCRAQLDDARFELNRTQDKMKPFFKEKKPVPAELTAEKLACDEDIALIAGTEQELIEQRDKALGSIGNIVDDSVLVSKDEDENPIVRTHGEFSNEAWMLTHTDLVEMAGLADSGKGSAVAGSRGYFLTGAGVMLNQALIQYGLQFLQAKGFTAMQTPFFMKQSIMGKVAQLAQFDEELYKVTGEGDDKYLIATSEQPICAYHLNEWLTPKDVPRHLAGVSTCFRKEAGSHGRDQLGIFRVHQFEKIEQFVVTSPEGRISWEEHERMIGNSEEFYRSLGIPFRVVNIVSGALNDAAAKKYDLEAWFPGSKAHRELVSCSNCTDYQARRLNCRYGQQGAKDSKQFAHMLNSTLTATERTICCIVENYQTPLGIKVPEVLVSFMGGTTFIPFKLPFPGKLKKGEVLAQHVPTEEELAEYEGGRTELGVYFERHNVSQTLSAALNTVAAERPADPIAALVKLLQARTGSAPTAASAADGKPVDEAWMKMSIEERVAHEKKTVRTGGMGLQFDPSEVKDDGGDATLDDFFGALGMTGGDGPIADDDDDEAVAEKPAEAEKKPAADEKREDEAWMKMSIEERVAHEKKTVRTGGMGLQFDPSEVKDDGGDATLDDFFGALGM